MRRVKDFKTGDIVDLAWLAGNAMARHGVVKKITQAAIYVTWPDQSVGTWRAHDLGLVTREGQNNTTEWYKPKRRKSRVGRGSL